MSEDPYVRAIVVVRCERCANRYGRGTRLGEMCLMPDHYGGGWAWAPVARRRDGYSRTREYQTGELRSGGGVAVHCHRCGQPYRFKVRTLAQLAAETPLRHAGAVPVGDLML